MDFNTYQHDAEQTAIYPKEQGLAYTALGLASEAGEYAGKVKKAIRDGTFDRMKAADELGDVLWYVAMSAKELGVTMTFVANRNLDKLAKRAEKQTLNGSGDER